MTVWVRAYEGPIIEHKAAVTFFTINDTLHVVAPGPSDGAVYVAGTWAAVAASEEIVTQWRRNIRAEERRNFDAIYAKGLRDGRAAASQDSPQTREATAEGVG